MANTSILEFYVKMRDMMSSGLVQLARTSQTQLQKVQKNIESVVKSNNDLERSFSSVERSAERSGNSLMTWGKRLTAAIGVAAVVAGTASFARSSIQESLQNDMRRQSFAVLTGNKGIGDSLSNELQKLAQDTVLGPEVFQQAQTMLGFGLNVEKVMPAMRMLGDISMGNAEKLKSMTLAFSQVSAAGRLTGQDLLQFVNAGFNPLNEISKMTGLSMVELKKEMEDGKISFDMVYKAMQRATSAGGTFNGMLDKMGGTTGGRIQQVQGAVQALKIAVGDRLKPAVDESVTAFARFVDSMRKMVEIPVAQKVDEQIQQIKMLQSELTASNTSHERRVQLLRELEQINPNIVAGINAEAIEYGKLAGNINNVVRALNQKKIASEIEQENVGTITRYNKAVEQQQLHLKEVAKLVSSVPGLSERNDLTIGQKQQYARQYYAAQALQLGSKDLSMKNVGSSAASVAYDYYLMTQIGEANKQAAIAADLAPQVKGIRSRINNAMKAYDDMFGIKQMNAAAGKSPASITPGGSVTGGATGADDKTATGKAIAAGGPRTINIHGVNMKVADSIQLSVNNAEEFVNELEPKMKEMLLRLLNSGSAVQG